MQKMSVLFFRHGQPLQHQDNRPARGANLDGLLGRIQDQDRGLHDHAFPRLGWFLWRLAVMALVSFVPFMHGPVLLPIDFLPMKRRPPSSRRSPLLWWPALP